MRDGFRASGPLWLLRCLWVWVSCWTIMAVGLGSATLLSLFTLRIGVSRWFPGFSRGISRLLLRCCGLRLNVIDFDRLDGPGPRLLVFNHSSQIDLFVGGSIMPPMATTVVKKEVIFVPFIGLAFIAFRFALIDRKNAERSRASMEKLANRVKTEKASVVILPEGTRSRTGELGTFKMGVFHLALATKAPIIPVIVRGASEVQPMGALMPRPGTIQAEVLEAIPTDHFTAENLTEQRDALRAMYLEALGLAPEDQAHAS